MTEYDRMARTILLDWLDNEIEFSDVHERDDMQQMTEQGLEDVHRKAEILRQRLLAQLECGEII